MRVIPITSFVAAVSLASCSVSRFGVTEQPGSVQVRREQQPVVSYRFDNEWKPYVAALWTPAGSQVLRDAPRDHSHHHGLMFALGIADVDFWGEVNTRVPGAQRGPAPRALVVGDASRAAQAVVDQHVSWIDLRDEKALGAEDRCIEVAGSSEVTELTWRSRLSVPEGRSSIELWGRHYFGLGIRLAADLDRVGRFVTPEGRAGELVRGDERLVRSRWCAYVVASSERAVTIAMFDHPDNPRHPATWFTMAKPFAYMAATLGLEADKMQITADEPLELCYGLAAWDGIVAGERIEAQYRSWLAATNDEEARR